MTVVANLKGIDVSRASSFSFRPYIAFSSASRYFPCLINIDARFPRVIDVRGCLGLGVIVHILSISRFIFSASG